MKKDLNKPDSLKPQQGDHLSSKTKAAGYGKPPAEFRWKKGQSGNSQGPRKTRLTKKAIREFVESVLFDDLITLRGPDGTSKRQVPKVHGLLLELTNSGLKGGVQATKLLFKLAEQYADDGDTSELAKETAEEDEAILCRHKLSPDAAAEGHRADGVGGTSAEQDDGEGEA